MLWRLWRRCFVWGMVTYILLVLPAWVWPSYLDTVAGGLVLAPTITVDLLQDLGIAGLLLKDGTCGWTLCSPTLWGWLAVALLWGGDRRHCGRGGHGVRPVYRLLPATVWRRDTVEQ